MSFSKFCLAVLCGLIFALFAYAWVQTQHREACTFAQMTQSEVAATILEKEQARFASDNETYLKQLQRHQDQPSQNPEPTQPTPVRWQNANDPNLLTVAQNAISQSQDASRLSPFYIDCLSAGNALFGFFVGGISYLIFAFVAFVCTKPLVYILDSPAANFGRLVIVPFISCVLIAGLGFALVDIILVDAIMPTPLFKLGLVRLI